MGAVYIAEQLSTGKQRALKLMHARLVDDPVQRKRFVREARVAAKVESEHVVEVLAAGVTESTAIPWLAMELLRGCDLSRLIRNSGPLTLAHALPIMEQLCHGLGAAHEAGIVHRDLKPQNVFLCRLASSTRPWTVKVLDFGIAKVVADRNQTTAALGSPAWMSPEQTDTSSDMAPAADVWALGLVLFWMLTGRFYWKAMNEQNAGVQAVLREMLFEPLVPPSERAADLEGGATFPAKLDDWFLGCVQRNPDDRFADANAAWRELRAITGEEVPASHVLPPEVAEIAARAAVDLTPDVAQSPPESGSPDATVLPSTRPEGMALSDKPVSEGVTVASGGMGRSSAPPSSHDATGEPGPTLQSHELGVARPSAGDGGRGRVKWLLAAAFVAGAGGAVALSEPADEPATPEPTSAAPPVPEPPSPTPAPSTSNTQNEPPTAPIVRAEVAVAAQRLEEAEKLAGEVLRELGAINGRRPSDTPPNPLGDRAQTVLARVSLARGALAGPLTADTTAPDVRKALDARESFTVEARLDCTKGRTWLGAEGSCCMVHVAKALAEAEAAAETAGLPAAPWTKQVEQAIETVGRSPDACRPIFEGVRDRHKAKTPNPSPTPSAPPQVPSLHPFNPMRAKHLLTAKAAAASQHCRHFLGRRAHSFIVTFEPRGYVTVSTPSAVDPAARCVHSMLSTVHLGPFDPASGKQSLPVSVSLP